MRTATRCLSTPSSNLDLVLMFESIKTHCFLLALQNTNTPTKFEDAPLTTPAAGKAADPVSTEGTAVLPPAASSGLANFVYLVLIVGVGASLFYWLGGARLIGRMLPGKLGAKYTKLGAHDDVER